ncbi:M23 family metallopeptidase [Riemerella anatipestifer]|uniref:M23 family metallopeptidase n=1 Tax=Riemerella anatipestifer TaxID=34085 RepID=UPI00208DFB33|nr:M23 family metallopeptidase [Riemerella anatipestifer]MCO4303200.1 M23 family metallopeptidase [Riemerella anatipestifer]MCO7353612.1 M23 family metallopeptidase [Riemerella anatipestifer]MCQ4039026.1 M23 family metallopeptidase [Riemerella anatipestifer]MCT6759964.1 M23 family metallopeptidase [Riemerella anatipestifer]MCT6764171.1 M23 family metallopeptidase [Riemerella anatipestifer]
MKFTHNPIKNPKLRTARLASINSARFGMTRNGGKRAHQGVDLASDVGYRVYAVENGKILSVNPNWGGLGQVVFLEINNPLKPQLHKKIATYAHLSRIDVKTGQEVEVGQQLGLTGDSGNAKGMTTVANGGHLHFELRTKLIAGFGLQNRIDPEPFINY